MQILAFDPGTIKTGFAILRDDELVRSGTFRLKGDLDDRLKQLWQHLNALTGFFDLVAIEMPPGHVRGRRADTGLKIGMGIGVALSFAFSRELPVMRIHHASAKKALAGSGRASKLDVQEAAKLRFGLAEIEEDAADAVAVGICAQSLTKSLTVFGGVL